MCCLKLATRHDPDHDDDDGRDADGSYGSIQLVLPLNRYTSQLLQPLNFQRPSRRKPGDVASTSVDADKNMPGFKQSLTCGTGPIKTLTYDEQRLFGPSEADKNSWPGTVSDTQNIAFRWWDESNKRQQSTHRQLLFHDLQISTNRCRWDSTANSCAVDRWLGRLKFWRLPTASTSGFYFTIRQCQCDKCKFSLTNVPSIVVACRGAQFLSWASSWACTCSTQATPRWKNQCVESSFTEDGAEALK